MHASNHGYTRFHAQAYIHARTRAYAHVPMCLPLQPSVDRRTQMPVHMNAHMPKHVFIHMWCLPTRQCPVQFVVAAIVMAYIVMAHTFMAYIVMVYAQVSIHRAYISYGLHTYGL